MSKNAELTEPQPEPHWEKQKGLGAEGDWLFPAWIGRGFFSLKTFRFGAVQPLPALRTPVNHQPLAAAFYRHIYMRYLEGRITSFWSWGAKSWYSKYGWGQKVNVKELKKGFVTDYVLKYFFFQWMDVLSGIIVPLKPLLFIIYLSMFYLLKPLCTLKPNDLLPQNPLRDICKIPKQNHFKRQLGSKTIKKKKYKNKLSNPAGAGWMRNLV